MDSRLCWSLLSESLRRGSGAAHAPLKGPLAQEDEAEEEEQEGWGAW